MPIYRYALRAGETKRLKIRRPFGDHDYYVYLDNELVRKIKKEESIQEGVEFELPDHSTLYLKFSPGKFLPGMEVMRNHQPIPGTLGDDFWKMDMKFILFYILAVINIIAGLPGIFNSHRYLPGVGMSLLWIAFGLALALLTRFLPRYKFSSLLILLSICAAELIIPIQSGWPEGLLVQILTILFGISCFKHLRMIQDQIDRPIP